MSEIAENMGEIGAKRVHEDRVLDKELKELSEKIARAKAEIGKMVLGQEKVIDYIFEALLANGHVLVEGIPGTGKTLLVRTLSKVSGSIYCPSVHSFQQPIVITEGLL